MFTVEQRDALRERVLRLAEQDEPQPAAGTLFIPTPTVPADIFGWGVIYALHARACIERGRVWQAEHYCGGVRDHALALSCLREGVTTTQARGYDDLSAGNLARFEDAHVGKVDPRLLRRALAGSVRALLKEAADAHLPHTGVVGDRLAESG